MYANVDECTEVAGNFESICCLNINRTPLGFKTKYIYFFIFNPSSSNRNLFAHFPSSFLTLDLVQNPAVETVINIYTSLFWSKCLCFMFLSVVLFVVGVVVVVMDSTELSWQNYEAFPFILTFKAYYCLNVVCIL